MKTVLTIATVGIAALIGGYWIGQASGHGMTGSESTESTERVILYWKAPMDPNYRREEPGKSPMGMDLVPVYADEANGEGDSGVRISSAMANNLGIRTVAVQQGTLPRLIETVGQIGYDESTLHTISARADGWIEKLHVESNGDPVEKGQVLFELFSPTLVNAQEEFLAALQSRNAGLKKASQTRLRSLGFSANEIDRLDRDRRVQNRVSVYSPHDGVVTDLGVREGQYITESTSIMSIGSLDEVWLMAEVLERQAGWIEIGQYADIELEASTGNARTGTVEYVYPEIDAKTRTAMARIRLDNADRTLKPNMFAKATVTADSVQDALHIPREAVIRGARTDRVVIANADGSFRSQPVSLGIESADRIQITSGLLPDDVVVSSGQFLIDSESNIDVALARYDSADTAASAMKSQQSDSANVEASVVAVDPDQRLVTLKHGPIEDWSMPGMTMVFDVADSVDLSDVSPEDEVHVAIERPEAGRFIATAMHKLSQMDRSESMHAHDMSADANEDAAEALASVVAVDQSARTLMLKHGPIRAWSMPGMTMMFSAAEDVDLSEVAPDDSVHVELRRGEDGDFVVTAIHPMTSEDSTSSDSHEGHR